MRNPINMIKAKKTSVSTNDSAFTGTKTDALMNKTTVAIQIYGIWGRAHDRQLAKQSNELCPICNKIGGISAPSFV